jgi:hypothetical protein
MNSYTLLKQFIDAYYNGASPREMEDLIDRATAHLKDLQAFESDVDPGDEDTPGYGAGV